MAFKEFVDLIAPYSDAIWKIIIMLQLLIISVILIKKNKNKE